jgi:beta-lactam-binding protein with PASTA domain
VTSERRAPTGTDAGVSDPMTGRLLDGRYRIRGRIARGGMASVYEATDLRLDRTVAVKVMHPGMGDDTEFADRFVREARAAARLSHPNVVAVYDQGTDDGTVFLAMEHVPGHTLRDVIRKEAPMAPGRALALLEPVVSALAAAHRAGLVHRDVKPENVLIADDSAGGAVKVADFGLAKAVSADTQHTATGGVLIGTVSYLAPELVVEGRSDARADVYAAGVVLFELLTGQKPHEGETPIQVAYKHVHEDVPAPSSMVDGIPPYVDALVARATARDRGQRPADAGVLLHLLHQVAHALAAGVWTDPDLEADLALRPVAAPAGLAGLDVDTAPQVFGQVAHGDDGGEHAAWLLPAAAAASAVDDRTTAIPREPASPAPPGPPAARARGRDEQPPAPPRRSRRGLVLLVVALVLVTAVGASAWWFGWARYTSTPAVLGMSQGAAVKELEAAGLEVEVGEPAYSESVPAGKVLATDPGAGERVLDGGTVTLTMSLGKERYDVPKLRGKTEDQAQDALAELKLDFGESTGQWSTNVPQGKVIRSDPPAGTTLRPGSIVDLVVSKGPRPVELRDFVGRSAATAQAWLEERGITVDASQTEHSDTVAEGDVISMDPPGGSRVYEGDTVSLVVSSGPELVAVPDGLRGSGVEAAKQQLEALGFEVEVRNAEGYLGLGYVWSVDPESGTEVPAGSTITLSII